MTLLEQAMQEQRVAQLSRKKRQQSIPYSIERAEVALAYVHGAITGNQAKVALGVENTSSLASCCSGLIVIGIRRGDIKAEMRGAE